MKILTYHGDETIVRLFSTMQQAIDYAVAEVKDCSGVEKPTVLTPKEMKDDYGWETEGVEMIILDNDWDDTERVYTIEDIDIDIVYENKFS